MLRAASRLTASPARIARSALTATASLLALVVASGGPAPARAQSPIDPAEQRLQSLEGGFGQGAGGGGHAENVVNDSKVIITICRK